MVTIKCEYPLDHCTQLFHVSLIKLGREKIMFDVEEFKNKKRTQKLTAGCSQQNSLRPCLGIKLVHVSLIKIGRKDISETGGVKVR